MTMHADQRAPIRLNSTEEVPAAMDAGTHPDQLFSREGYPMLGVAILEDKKSLAMDMLDRGADPLLKFNDQVFNSPLAVAMNRLTHQDIFCRMVDDQRVLNVRGEKGENLMHRAAAGCSPVVMLELAKRGLDVNQPDNAGVTPLRSALNSGGNGGFIGYGMDIAANVRVLRALGADPVELTASERSSKSKIIQDAGLAMVEGPLLNAVRTRLPDLVRLAATRLGMDMDAGDLAQARAFVGTAKPNLAWEEDMQNAIGPFADAILAKAAIRRVSSSREASLHAPAKR